jgi:hypothetical protein
MTPGPHFMKSIILATLASLGLAGCGATPISQAQQAENAACTAQADAQYRQNTVDQEARVDQTGQRYSATPNHVFDAETMGAQSQREHQIQNCEETGNNNGLPVAPGFTPVAPHIITN